MRFAVATFIAALSFTTQVLAAPTVASSLARRDVASSISTITGAIDTLKSDVESELQGIVNAAGDPSSSTIPTIQQNLFKIVVSYNTALSTIVPVIVGTQVNLTVAQAEPLLDSVKNFNTLVSELQSDFTNVLATVAQNQIAFIQPQLEAAANIASTLSSNFVQFITGVANAIYDPDGVVSSQLEATATEIQTTVSNLQNQY